MISCFDKIFAGLSWISAEHTSIGWICHHPFEVSPVINLLGSPVLILVAVLLILCVLWHLVRWSHHWGEQGAGYGLCDDNASWTPRLVHCFTSRCWASSSDPSPSSSLLTARWLLLLCQSSNQWFVKRREFFLGINEAIKVSYDLKSTHDVESLHVHLSIKY